MTNFTSKSKFLKTCHPETVNMTLLPVAFGWNKSSSQTMKVSETTDALQASPTSNPAVWEMSHASEAVRENGEVVPTLQARMGTGGNQVPMVGVRRLMPIECERLQGFPDLWTDGQSDTQRYKQLGNAVAVPVVEWIARRIQKVEASVLQGYPVRQT